MAIDYTVTIYHLSMIGKQANSATTEFYCIVDHAYRDQCM